MIKEKIYYYFSIETLSPLAIGNGNNDLTDHDLIRDAYGDIFIPATSLAGVFVHYLNEEERKKILKEKDNEKIISPMFISDATIKPNTTYITSIRNGVKLTEDKVTEDGAKYDIEIVEKGLKLDFRIELTIREDDDSDEYQRIIDKLISNLNNGNIVVGFKSKRGFGKVKINDSFYKSFKSTDLDNLLSFDKYKIQDYDRYEIKDSNDSNYDILSVSLKQLGGLSIRSYTARAFDVDFEHIKSNGTPIIPGTSFNGWIRKQVEYYHKLLGNKDNRVIKDWFGYVDNATKTSMASKVIIDESVINNSKEIMMVRNKIDRFSGGAADKALFSEKIQFNGDTVLTIRIPKQIKINNVITYNDYLLGLLGLTIKDIDNGLIALGGQTSIGRGIFEVIEVNLNNNKIDIDELINNISLEAVNE